MLFGDSAATQSVAPLIARDAMSPIAVVANAMDDEDDVLDVEIGRRRSILEKRRIAGEIVQRRRGTGG
jgi:hypothetical protein